MLILQRFYCIIVLINQLNMVFPRGPMTHITYNLFNLKRELEIKTQEEYTWQRIADISEIHKNTIYNLANNRTQRVDLNVMARLLDFFASQGLPIGINDLFIVTDELDG